MHKLWMVALVFMLAGCRDSSTQGYIYECSPATELDKNCQKLWLPTVLDGGESISQGFSSIARLDLATQADFRHDDWDNGNIFPQDNTYFTGAVADRSINDGNSLQLLERMEVALNGRYYSALVLNSVTHDITLTWSGAPEVSPAHYRDNLEALAQLAEQHASVVIWMNTPPIPEGSLGPYVPASQVQVYNAIADEVAHEHGFYVLDVPGIDHLPGANVHYTAEGYKILGREVADCVLVGLEGLFTDQCHR